MVGFDFSANADNTEFINNITKNAEHTRKNTVLTWFDILQETIFKYGFYKLKLDVQSWATGFFILIAQVVTEHPMLIWNTAVDEYITFFNKNVALQILQILMQTLQNLIVRETVIGRKCRINHSYLIADNTEFLGFNTNNAEFAFWNGAEFCKFCDGKQKNAEFAEYRQFWPFLHFLQNFAEKWVNLGLSQKFCQNFCGPQNLQEDNMELTKR